MKALDSYWRNWQAARCSQLQADDLPLLEAQHISLSEAQSRAAAAKLIGDDAASKADLITERRWNGTCSVYLKVPVRSVPRHMLANATAQALPDDLAEAIMQAAYSDSRGDVDA